MPFPVGTNVTIEIGTTEGSAKTLASLTAADPAVAGSTAHGLSAGSVGYLSSIAGMIEVDGQAVRVANVDTDDFECEGLDTSLMDAFVSGSFIPVTAFASLGECESIAISEAAPLQIEQRPLSVGQAMQVNAGIGAQSATFGAFATMQAAGMQAVIAAAYNRTPKLFRVTDEGGEQCIFRGWASGPGKNWSAGQSLTTGFTVTIIGRPLFLAAL